MSKAISLTIIFLISGCAGIQLTEKGKLVRIADQEQQTTFKLNDHCLQSPQTVQYRDMNDARNVAAEQNYNVVQKIFENAYYHTGQARMWRCPDGIP